MASWFLILAAAATPAPDSAQAQFDAATAAADRSDDAAALAGFTALEARLAGGRNKGTLAVVRVRRGLALARMGRDAPAIAAIRAGLETFPGPTDPSGDRAEGLVTLGGIEENALDYGAARRDYEAALALAPAEATAFPALAGVARTTMFDDPARARDAIDKAVALLKPDSPKPLVAQLRTLRGRVLMNGGDARGAVVELRRAVGELGGLTERVDRNDIEARSDVAVAALLAGNTQVAREYMAYTGAGRGKVQLPSVGGASLPPCGDPDGLKPDDTAVIQFAIGNDGAVQNVRPIYASRSGPVALAFARAVATWSWPPAALSEISPFFRSLTRLQLRCSAEQSQPPVLAQLTAPINGWYAARGIANPRRDADDRSRSLTERRVALAEARAGGDPAITAASLLAIATHPRAPEDESRAAYAEAETMLAEAKAPADVRAATRAQRLLAESEAGEGGRAARARFLATLRTALQEPLVRASPRASAVIRLSLADQLSRGGNADERTALLAAVVNDPALDKADPLRVGALVRQASLFAERRDLYAARAAYARTGLTAQQCALVGARPALVNSRSGPNDFPRDAFEWGFEGWSRQEFDIDADGRTRNVRAIVAYPPFVFDKAGESVMAKARYQQSYRPEGGLGCSAETQVVKFGLPGE